MGSDGKIRAHRYNAVSSMTKPGRPRHVSFVRLAAVVAAGIAAAVPIPSALVEAWFSTGIYPRIQRVVTPVSNLMPIAWLDVLSLAAAAWLAWAWWRALRRDGTPRLPRVAQTAAGTLFVAACCYLVFLALWGFNYRRVSMSARLALETDQPVTADVATLGRDVATRLNGLYAPAHNSGFRETTWRNARLRAAFDEVQAHLVDGPPAVPGRLKHTLFGPFFRWTGVDGMINPFGLEVLANPDLLAFEQPFVAAHEWAHLAGYADESEANFVGWLTCVRADTASQYSGWLYLYWQVAGELPAVERAAMAKTLTAGPRDDLAAIAARLRRGDLPALRRASWMVYDSYLKANRVEAGVRSYGEVVTLILRARFEDGWRPLRRASTQP
jgi:Protein of unknown function (DUF3810)